MDSPTNQRLDAQFEHVTDTFELAKANLPERKKTPRWTIFWRALAVAGVMVFAVFAGFVINDLGNLGQQDNQVLNRHTPYFKHIQQTTDSLCRHTPGCVVSPVQVSGK